MLSWMKTTNVVSNFWPISICHYFVFGGITKYKIESYEGRLVSRKQKWDSKYFWKVRIMSKQTRLKCRLLRLLLELLVLSIGLGKSSDCFCGPVCHMAAESSGWTGLSYVPQQSDVGHQFNLQAKLKEDQRCRLCWKVNYEGYAKELSVFSLKL